MKRIKRAKLDIKKLKMLTEKSLAKITGGFVYGDPGDYDPPPPRPKNGNGYYN